MGLIHLCLSFVTPAGSRRSSRAVSADHSEEPTPFSGGEFLKGIESPSRDEFVYYGRKRLSSEVDESAMLNKSWPDAWHSRSSASSGSSPLFGPPLNLNRHARLPRLPYMESPPRGGTYSAGGGCEVCHGLVYDNLSLADKSCELMKTIMGDLLDMQRLEAGQVVMAKSSGTLLDVIRHVTRLAETQLLMHAETAETVSRIRSHSRRLTSGDSGFAAVERAMGGEGGGDLGRGPRLSDPPGKKVRGRWEWVQSDGGRVGEGRVNGRAILRYVCDAGVSGTKYEMDRARMEQVRPEGLLVICADLVWVSCLA